MSATVFTEPTAFALPVSLRVPDRETVSVIIPCYNEERFIGKALENLAGQYPAEKYEIIVVDGMSSDRTREVVADFQQRRPEIRISVVDNPVRNIPCALNLGIARAQGKIIARMDAHAAPSPGYIQKCVEVLHKGETAVVGMPCRVLPGDDTAMAHAIALAVSHPFGIGDAKYRLAKNSDAVQEEVDTVAFACFRKTLWVELGGFDENLLTNEDYDFNYRARMRGEKVVLDTSAHCDYFARPTLSKLAAQYQRYGFWKARMLRQQPRSMKLRHLVAPGFVASIFLLMIAGFWTSFAWNFLTIEIGVYLLASLVFAFQATRRSQSRVPVMVWMPPVFLTIHFSWGSSFLMGLITRR